MYSHEGSTHSPLVSQVPFCTGCSFSQAASKTVDDKEVANHFTYHFTGEAYSVTALQAKTLDSLQGLHLQGFHLQGLHLQGLHLQGPDATYSQTEIAFCSKKKSSLATTQLSPAESSSKGVFRRVLYNNIEFLLCLLPIYTLAALREL